MLKAICRMLRELKEAILYASETRNSSPVRVLRNAGGIVSPAPDEMKSVEQHMLTN
ncbi:MAG: hypothetical protein U9P12_08210 [Verrucomicrobiota bacterium]|nr:hypothetical protein [Verrucomicrobiota bacterium]